MTKWDIQDAEALGIVGTAWTSVEGYEGQIGSLGTAMVNTMKHLGNSELVSFTMFEFGERVVRGHVNLISGHSISAVRGTSDAIGFYGHGQLDMAATAQRNAKESAYPETMPGKAGGSALPKPDAWKGRGGQ